MKNVHTLILIAIVVMGASSASCERMGADQNPANNLDAASSEDADVSAPDAGVFVDVDDATDPFVDPIDTSTQTWCQPAPIPYDVSVLPSLPEGFDVESFCDDGGLMPPEGAQTHRYTFDPTARVLESVADSFGVSGGLFQRFELDDEDRVRHIYVRGTSGFYTTGTGESWYDLDEVGEVVHKEAVETSFLVIEEDPVAPTPFIKDQLWDGERLISREERNGEEGPVNRRWAWRFDEDRLVEATLTDTTDPARTRTWESRFEYHSSGAPAQVERRIDGVLVEEERWTFTTEGRLASRTFWSQSPARLVVLHGGEPQDWLMVTGLDSYERTSREFDFSTDPWASASIEPGADCAKLPRGPGHGYPDAEAEYQLGVSRDARPQAIGAAYGNDHFGWYYGDHAWYGHDGLASGWLSSPAGGLAEELLVTVRYDSAGRMISESAEVSPFEGATVELERAREIVAGRVIEDALEINEGPARHQRVLRFEHDANGLISRTLLVEGEPVEQQTWSRDARGRVLSHAVHASDDWRAQTVTEVASLWVIDGASQGRLSEHDWSWRYEGDLLVERISDGNVQTLRHDPEGRLIEQLGEFSSEPGDIRQTWAFDDAGRQISQCVDYGEAGINCTTTVHDAQGRVAWKETASSGAPPQLTELRHYECTP